MSKCTNCKHFIPVDNFYAYFSCELGLLENKDNIESVENCKYFEKNEVNTLFQYVAQQNNPYTATGDALKSLCRLKKVEYIEDEPDNVIRDRLLMKIEEEKNQKKKLYIRWFDSGYSIRSDIWQTKEEVENLLNELKEVETIGFVIAENDKWIVLAQSVNMDMIRGGYIILKSNIIEQREV